MTTTGITGIDPQKSVLKLNLDIQIGLEIDPSRRDYVNTHTHLHSKPRNLSLDLIHSSRLGFHNPPKDYSRPLEHQVLHSVSLARHVNVYTLICSAVQLIWTGVHTIHAQSTTSFPNTYISLTLEICLIREHGHLIPS